VVERAVDRQLTADAARGTGAVFGTGAGAGIPRAPRAEQEAVIRSV